MSTTDMIKIADIKKELEETTRKEGLMIYNEKF